MKKTQQPLGRGNGHAPTALIKTDPVLPRPLDGAQIRYGNFMCLYQRFKDEHSHLPDRGMLKLFAARVGLSDRYLSHLKCNRKNIGTNVARTIENALGLQRGWMDREHAEGECAGNASDDAEKMFLETARMLYRAEPEAMRRVIMDLLQKKLEAEAL